MSTSNRLRLFHRTAKAAALATMISAPALHAASGTWNLDNNGSWGAGTSWTGGISGNIDDVAAFMNNISAARTVTLDGSRTIGTLQIGDADSTAAFTPRAVPTGGGITFDVSGGNAPLNFSSGLAIANTITVPLILNDNLRIAITGASTAAQIINGPISGAQSVTLDASGQAALNALGQVTFNGNITVQQAGAALTTRFNTHTTGTIVNVINGVVSGNANVEFTKSDAAGTSTWVLGNNANYTGTTLIGLNAGGTGASVLQLGNGGATGSLLESSAVTIASGSVLGFNRSNAYTFTNTVSGAGGVTNSGVGTITWDNGTSGYTGPTVVSGANDAARLVFGSGGGYTFSGAAAAVTLSNGADLEFKT